ncbi:serine hydrolase [Emticicia sp. 17c]|uniref:serine hydrolase n=1 Tax=Emticicia sp. 17c TaxID=3127704 RepID=UPI00301D8BCF
MKINILLPLIFLVGFLYGQTSDAQAQKFDAMKIENYIAKLPAPIKITMAVESIAGEKYFMYRAQVKVPAASIIKIPVLAALMEKVKLGQIDLNAKHLLQATDKTWDTGVIASMPDGKQISIRELAQEMIRTSDNTATNILIGKVGMAGVNQNLIRLGSTQTRLNRIMLDTMAVKQGRENYVNTLEINDLLRKIYRKEVATPALCEEMIEMLKNCADTATIPNKLPKTLVIAHKTGSLSYVRSDAAIVYTSEPFIISVFVEGFASETQAEQIIADLAALCWENLK